MLNRKAILFFLLHLVGYKNSSAENYLIEQGYKGHVKSIHTKMWQMGEDSAGIKVNKLVEDEFLLFNTDSQLTNKSGTCTTEYRYSEYGGGEGFELRQRITGELTMKTID